MNVELISDDFLKFKHTYPKIKKVVISGKEISFKVVNKHGKEEYLTAYDLDDWDVTITED